MTIEQARTYCLNHGGLQFAAYRDGACVVNEAQNGAEMIPQIIHSCTKSVAAFALYRMIKLGLVPSLDTKVSTFVPSWASAAGLMHFRKRNTTFRQIPSMTSGLYPGLLMPDIAYADAVSTAYNMPGFAVGHFHYGPSSLAVLGYVMHQAGIASPVDFIKAELAAIGVEVADWHLIADDYAQPRLDGFAFMLAEQLAKFGEWMRVTLPDDPLLREFVTNQVQDTDEPLYGLGFWLCTDADNFSRDHPLPPGVFAAIGATSPERRIMVVAPHLNLVAACFVANAPTWDDTKFVAKLLAA